MVPTTRRARRGFSELPTDVLFDVLLPLSAKELCRLRVVCREWRSLTSDPRFIRAHAARHRRDPPLFVASFLLPGPGEQPEPKQTMRVDLIDVSGKTVRRVAEATDRGNVLCPRLALVCVPSKSDNTCCRVLDPAAPATSRCVRLPVLPAPAHRGISRRRLRKTATSFALGRVAATGEHKVMRIFHRRKDDGDDRPHHLFEVLTLGVAGRRRARWRDVPSPDMLVYPDSSAVVDGVVYFLRSAAYNNDDDDDDVPTAYNGGGTVVDVVLPADCVASFDLEREEWRKRLQGPISMGMGHVDGDDDGSDSDDDRRGQFALAELKGSLVLLHHGYMMTSDVWILSDFERGVWVKEYSISVNSIMPAYRRRPKPLFVLDDGRLVVRSRVSEKLAVYDPRTDAWARVESGPLSIGAVGIYAGSLLGLQDAS